MQTYRIHGYGKDADIVAGSILFQLPNRGGPDSPGRVVDHPFKGLIILVVDHQPEIGQQVFDLLSLVKRESPIDFVGNVAFAKHLLKHPRLGIGPVQNGKIRIVVVFCHPLLKNFVHH